MSQTNISIRVDEDVKKDAESVFARLGLSLSAATNVFYRQAVRTQSIPFPLIAGDTEDMKLSRDEVLNKGLIALKEVQAQAIINGTSNMSLDEINAMVAECRKEYKKS